MSIPWILTGSRKPFSLAEVHLFAFTRVVLETVLLAPPHEVLVHFPLFSVIAVRNEAGSHIPILLSPVSLQRAALYLSLKHLNASSKWGQKQK